MKYKVIRCKKCRQLFGCYRDDLKNRRLSTNSVSLNDTKDLRCPNCGAVIDD